MRKGEKRIVFEDVGLPLFLFFSPFSVLVSSIQEPFCRAVIHSFVFACIPTFIHSFIHGHSFVHSIFACKASTVFTSSGKMSLLLIVLVQISLLFRNVISTCSTTSDVEFTFYGFPDGPSDTTSFGCSGTTQVADGTAGGSF